MFGILGRLTGLRHGNSPTRRRGTRLRMEPLEDRRLLATFVVNTTVDAVDTTTLGDGQVDTAPGTPGNQISLRAAIQEANALAGDDVIQLPAGNYLFSLQGQVGQVQQEEEFAARGDLDIRGTLVLSGAGAEATIIDAAGLDRVFHVFSGVRFEASGVTIRGGIANTPAAPLSNASLMGGGIYNGGQLVLNNTTISGNTAQMFGGGVANVGFLSTMTADNCLFADNEAVAGSGGALITGAILEGSNNVTANITNSTFLRNTAASSGGGIFAHSGSAEVSRSTFAQNDGGSFGGGAIENFNTTFTLTNSTLSGNVAASGGAIRNSAVMFVRFVTVADNRTQNYGLGEGPGGGIANTGQLNIINTIVADNASAGGGPDVSGFVASQGFNLIGDSTGSFAWVASDLLDVAANLGPLADNGGPTLTHALLPSSPAVDAGDTSLQVPPQTDQRGLARRFNGRVDIGAFELQTIMTPTAIVAGADAGGQPLVRVSTRRFAFDNPPPITFLAYAATFTGGVRVATGDVNGDGLADIITAPGPGGGPHIRVFDGQTGLPLAGALGSFFAYDPSFTGGVFVAAGDVNGDGRVDIITGAGAGGGPHVRVFDGSKGAVLDSFYAYSASFSGGVQVAAGDINGDGRADIVTGAGAGGGPHVKAFSGIDKNLLYSFLAYGAGFSGGVSVAVGDVNGDGLADIITGAGPGGGAHVKVFSGDTGALLQSFFPYGSVFTGGVRVGAGDVDGDGRADIITGTGAGGGPHVRAFDGLTLAELDSFFAFEGSFTGGVFVAGSRLL